jgi:pimeloyl-ACP methyl ester carboxylesterase
LKKFLVIFFLILFGAGCGEQKDQAKNPMTNKIDSSFKTEYATVNGIKMYYEIRGDGYPLVLIHGGGSTINTTFGKVIPMLSKTHKVVAVELQTHGRTGDRNAPESFEQDAKDVVELLNQLQIPKADFFGFSNGGQTAMQIAMKNPGIVNKLIIASAFYKRSATPPGFWDGFANAKLSDMPKVYQDEYLKLTNDPKGLQNMFNKDVERMSNFKDWKEEDLKTINAPALIVAGDQDVALVEHTVEMHRLIKNSRLALFPANHGSYMGEAMSPDPNSKMPELFVAMLNEFLSAPETK